MQIIPDRTLVRLPDGTTATCYRERGIGRPFDGHYVTAQTVGGITRRDYGWTADQLEVVAP